MPDTPSGAFVKAGLERALADPALSAKAYAQTFAYGLTAAKASEHYIKSGDAGVAEYVDSKGGPPTEPDKPSLAAFGVTNENWQDAVVAGKVLVDRIREQPQVERTLFRGIADSKAIPDLENAQPGQTLSLARLSSFTADERTAVNYAWNGDHKYVVVLEGRSQALGTDQLTGMGHQEFLTTGLFEVIKVDGPYRYKLGEKNSRGRKTEDIRRRVVLRQKGVF